MKQMLKRVFTTEVRGKISTALVFAGVILGIGTVGSLETERISEVQFLIQCGISVAMWISAFFAMVIGNDDF